jgi:hypothetical protein
MQCREINDLIMKYFDGDISELEYEMIVKHNEKCTDCAFEFRVLKEAICAVEELPELEVPDGFQNKVMYKVKTSAPYTMNPKVLFFWLISVLGLMVFAWNMLSFVVVPYVRESGVLIMAQNLIIYSYNTISGLLKDMLIEASVLFGKIFKYRNILLRDYITFVTAIVLIFTGISVLMVNKLKLGENQEGFK